MTDFSSFGLPETLLKALAKINFTEPTPIQAQAIPLAMQGRDVLGTAATGTGKTAAFALPMLAHLLDNPDSVALIMAPTRELAMQVLATIQPLMVFHRNIGTACLIGGDSIQKQHQHLKRHPRLIVGTPGRINDHLARGWLNLSRADFLVLDETDRMLDMGFGVQIEKIIKVMARDRQTLMFSATMPKEIIRMADQYLVKPERITVGTVNKPAAKIKQELIHVKDADKLGVLFEQLEARTGSVIIFVKTKYGTEKLAKKLDQAGHQAEAIHGDLRQNKRNRVIQDFRDMKYRILVATDVAARGLDIPHIEHVINYDLPQQPEDYIHRIGRTARAGAEGEAVNLVTPGEADKWRAIHKLMNPDEKQPKHKDARRDKAEADDARKQARKNAPSRDRRFRDDSRFNDNRSRGGDRPRGDRFERDERPARFAREDRPARFVRDARPARADRDDRPMRGRANDEGNRNWRNGDFRDTGAQRKSRDEGRSYGRRDDRRGNTGGKRGGFAGKPRFDRDDRAQSRDFGHATRRDRNDDAFREERNGSQRRQKKTATAKPQGDSGRKVYNTSPFSPKTRTAGGKKAGGGVAGKRRRSA